MLSGVGNLGDRNMIWLRKAVFSCKRDDRLLFTFLHLLTQLHFSGIAL